MGKAAALTKPRANTAPPNKRQAQGLAALSEQVATIAAGFKLLSDQNAELTRALARQQGVSTPGNHIRDVPPLAPRGRSMVDSGDVGPIGGDGDVVTMAEDKNRKPYLKERMIEAEDGAQIIDKEWAANMRFNEEKVIVIVHEEADAKYPEPCISVWNGGRHQLFPRGVEITCARKFLEVLARSKPVRYGNVEFVNEEGVRDVKWPKRVSHRYPFTVVEDRNPLGRAWLKKIFSES